MAPADAKKKIVRKASKMMNPFEALKCEASVPTHIDGEPISFSCLWGTHLTDDQFDWVFNLFADNMRGMYEISQWGYDPVSKKNELRSTTSRYIIAKNASSIPVAYCHYRFDMDNGFAVIYCYEIQVEKAYQAKGLGTALMSMLDNIGKRTSMDKIVATVFAFNEKSLGFFHKLGYAADVTCPDAEQDLDYLILSKDCC